MNQNLYMSTLLKAFDIIDCFQNDRQELGISDIAAMVDMPVSSVHRIIQSLEFVACSRRTVKTGNTRSAPGC